MAGAVIGAATIGSPGPRLWAPPAQLASRNTTEGFPGGPADNRGLDSPAGAENVLEAYLSSRTRGPPLYGHGHGPGNGLAARGLAPRDRRLVRTRPGAGGSRCGARAVATRAR